MVNANQSGIFTVIWNSVDDTMLIIFESCHCYLERLDDILLSNLDFITYLEQLANEQVMI
jgi:hypothetical protein